MTTQNKMVLKSYFNTGDVPTESNFADLIDTLIDPPALQTVIDAHKIDATPHTALTTHEARADVHYIPRHDTLTLAADDATTLSKQQSDHVCIGTGDEAELQSVLADLPAYGGSIKLTEGTFIFNRAGVYTGDGRSDPYSVLIDHEKAISLTGILGATKISFRPGAPEPLLFMIFIRGTAANPRVKPITIQGIEFLGNNLVAECVDGKYSTDVMVDHCRFSGGGGDNISSLHLSWCGGKSIITHNYFVEKRGLAVENNNFIVAHNIFDCAGIDDSQPLCWLASDWDLEWAGGVYYSQYSSSVIGNTFIGGEVQLNLNATRGCTVMGNTFSFQTGAHYGALLLNACPIVTAPRQPGFDAVGNVIVGNTFTDSHYGIQILGYASVPTDVGCIGNIIAENTFNRDKDNHTYDYGITESGGTCDKNQIINNYFDPAGVAVISKIGANTIVYGNVGYKTEGFGAAGAIADGGTIDHGLVTTPTWANVTPSVTGEMVTITTLDATHITVAIKKHDGAAGTAQTLYWEARV